MRKHQKQKANKLKISIFSLLIFIILILICIYLFKDNLFVKKSSTSKTNNIQTLVLPTKVSEDQKSKTVIGAEYLEVSSFALNFSDSNTEVSSAITNTSESEYSNLNLLINFFSSNNEVITTLTCKISSIAPNEKKYICGKVNSNLAESKDYTITLVK